MQGYINYNSANGYEKFYPYAYKSDDSLKLGGIDSSQYVLVSNLNSIITKSQTYNFSLEIPMTNTNFWSTDSQYAKNDLGLTIFDLNYDVLFCSYSITITAIKNNRTPDGAYIILQGDFLGENNFTTRRIKDNLTSTSNFHYSCLRSGEDSYTAVSKNSLTGNFLPSVIMSNKNYNYQASVKIQGEYYYIKF